MHKKNRILATDLDGTLFMPMSKGIGSGIGSLRQKLADNPAVCLVFASGRSLKLIEEAIEQYDLPKPDMTVGDVGTSIYVHNGESWELDAGWRELMSDGWQGHSREEIAGIFLAQISGGGAPATCCFCFSLIGQYADLNDLVGRGGWLRRFNASA